MRTATILEIKCENLLFSHSSNDFPSNLPIEAQRSVSPVNSPSVTGSAPDPSAICHNTGHNRIPMVKNANLVKSAEEATTLVVDGPPDSSLPLDKTPKRSSIVVARASLTFKSITETIASQSRSTANVEPQPVNPSLVTGSAPDSSANCHNPGHNRIPTVKNAKLLKSAEEATTPVVDGLPDSSSPLDKKPQRSSPGLTQSRSTANVEHQQDVNNPQSPQIVSPEDQTQEPDEPAMEIKPTVLGEQEINPLINEQLDKGKIGERHPPLLSSSSCDPSVTNAQGVLNTKPKRKVRFDDKEQVINADEYNQKTVGTSKKRKSSFRSKPKDPKGKHHGHSSRSHEKRRESIKDEEHAERRTSSHSPDHTTEGKSCQYVDKYGERYHHSKRSDPEYNSENQHRGSRRSPPPDDRDYHSRYSNKSGVEEGDTHRLRGREEGECTEGSGAYVKSKRRRLSSFETEGRCMARISSDRYESHHEYDDERSRDRSRGASRDESPYYSRSDSSYYGPSSETVGKSSYYSHEHQRKHSSREAEYPESRSRSHREYNEEGMSTWEQGKHLHAMEAGTSTSSPTSVGSSYGALGTTPPPKVRSMNKMI